MFPFNPSFNLMNSATLVLACVSAEHIQKQFPLCPQQHFLLRRY
jgi:hypothetical protein